MIQLAKGITVSKRNFGEIFWVASSRILVALIAMASVRVLTELAPKHVFGYASLILGFVALGSSASVAPIAQTQARFHIAYRDAGHGQWYTNKITKIAFAACAGMLLVALAGLVLVTAGNVQAYTSLLVVVPLLLLSVAYRDVRLGKLTAERERKQVAIWVVLDAGLTFAFSAGFLFLAPVALSIVAGQACGVLVTAVIFGALIQTAPNRADAPLLAGDGEKVKRQLLQYGTPFIGFAFLGWASNLSERYVLGAYLDLASVGLYVAAFGLASRLPTIWGGLLSELLRPMLFQASNRNAEEHAERIFYLWLGVLVLSLTVLWVFVWIFADWIVFLLLAESYRQGAPELIYWITAGYCLAVLAQSIESKIMATGNSRPLIFTKAIGAAGNLAAAFLLIPIVGVLGAAQANLLGQLLFFLATAGALLLLRSKTLAKN